MSVLVIYVLQKKFTQFFKDFGTKTEVVFTIVCPFLMDLFFGEWRSNAVTASGDHEEEAAANNADDDRQTGEKLLDVFRRNRE